MMHVMLTADCKEGLKEKLGNLCSHAEQWQQPEYRMAAAGNGSCRLAFVAETEAEAAEKSALALELLEQEEKTFWVQKEIAYSEVSMKEGARVAVMFPGQGTQQAGMLKELAENCTEMKEALALADQIMAETGDRSISGLLYPDMEAEGALAEAEAALQKTNYTQPALAATDAGLYQLACSRGLQADCLMGHSFGELAALWAEGVYDMETFFRLSRERGKAMSRTQENTGMMAVMTDREKVQEAAAAYEHVFVANANSPKQTVVSGDAGEIAELEKSLKAQKIRGVKLKVSGAFHSPYMKEAADEFRSFMNGCPMEASKGSVIANCTGTYYPAESADEVRDLLEQQLLQPVLFVDSIKKAYADGVRVFVEVGNGKVLGNLIKDILPEQDYEVIPLCPEKNKSSEVQFEWAMARLAVLGVLAY